MLPLMITAIENDDDRQLAAELYTRYRAVMLRRAGSILKEDDRGRGGGAGGHAAGDPPPGKGADDPRK